MDSYKLNYEDSITKTAERNLFNRVYLLMALAMAVTGVSAYLNIMFPAVLRFISSLNTIGFFGLLALQIGLVMFLTSSIQNMSIGTALLAFAVYSAFMGVFLAFYTAVYGIFTVYKAFIVTFGMFAGASLIGFNTKTDLSGMGRIFSMAIWGLLLTAVVNIIMKSPALDYIICMVGVALFTGLTAWDTQKIKMMSDSMKNSNETSFMRVALFGALHLYLDFINLLFFLIRILGRRN